MFRAYKSFLLFLIAAVFFTAFTNSENPFNYDLHLYRIPGESGKTMVCMHGKGGDYSIADNVKQHAQIGDTIVGFNFPDYGIRTGQKKLEDVKYGTIDELLPAIYVLKKLVIDEGLSEINLYGFSAGGGAIINMLGVLNSSTYDMQLKKIGVQQKEKEKLLNAVQKGNVILDTPLKSIREIVANRGPACELVPFEKRYRENNMEPIDSIQEIDNLKLTVWVHFQQPDEVLSNRDDAMYIERIKKYNSHGKTHIVLGYDSGHSLPHHSLWKAYNQENQAYYKEKGTRKYIVGIKMRTSNKDCREDISMLKERFFREKVADKVPSKLNQNVYAVYHEYEKDYTKPYSYTLGYEVANLEQIPEGLCGVVVEEGEYAVFPVKGPFPIALMETWYKIWQTPLNRVYHTDYEIYPPEFNLDDSSGLKVYIQVK